MADPQLAYVDTPVTAAAFTSSNATYQNGDEYVICPNYGLLAGTVVPSNYFGINRLTEKVRMTSLSINLFVSGNINVYTSTQHYRCIVFYDSKSNGFQYNSVSSGVPTGGYLSGNVQNTSAGSGAPPEPVLDTYATGYANNPCNNQCIQQYNHMAVNLQKRYKILYDKVHTLQPYITAGTPIHHLQKKIKLGRTCTYGAAGYNVYPEDNALYVVLCSDIYGQSGNAYVAQGTIRLRYKSVT